MKILADGYLAARIRLLVSRSLLSCGLLSAGLSPAEESAAKLGQKETANRGTELFVSTILPVLVNSCYECHSQAGETIEGGLELDSPSGLLRGGDSGAMFTAHQPEQSRLLPILRHEDDVSGMPPEEPLPDEIIAAFENWIQLGAPDTRQQSGPTAREQRIQQAQQHWAFQPAHAVELPAVKAVDWPRDRIIDSFVLARIESQDMKPVDDANRKTLIRRLYFDLVGLPPSVQDVDAFVADKSSDALQKLVDRLLDSPQFGERWGRHWLDVVRFAESSGMEFNFTYPHAWPYRNYVIDAFNADKPFDQFLAEQIAGDLVPGNENESPLDAQARRIAPSLLAFGPKRHNSSGTEFQIDIADDQIDVVCKASMALTVSCARCHDHKFDPIPTKDYYALAGIFLSTEPLYGTVKQKYSNTPTELVPLGEDAQAIHERADAHDKLLAASEKSLAEKREELDTAVEAEKSASKVKTDAEGMLAAISSRVSAPRDTASATDSAVANTAEQDSVKSELDQAIAAATEAAARVETLRDQVAKLEVDVAELKKNSPPRPAYAMSVRDRAKPADTKLAIRGDFRDRGEVVPRGFLTAVKVPRVATIDTAGSGRLELAKWITSPNNPLTARVMVNRIWHHLLGRGIVPTVDNFGVIGQPPSHPQLLDSLALRFIQDGWSVKRMIRAIVLSRTYGLSSRVDEQNMATDPDNRLFWRATPRRLEAEAIRDAILAVSGQLDLQRVNGSTVTALGDTLVRSIPMDKIQPASNQRSVYLPVVRDYVPELFDLFDFPSPSLVSGRRAITNVPSQALYLRNSAFVATQARFAAQRLLASTAASNDAERVNLAMRWALGRAPSDAECTAALQLVHDVGQAAEQSTAEQRAATANGAAHSDDNAASLTAWSAWFLTLFSTAEFRYLVDIDS